VFSCQKRARKEIYSDISEKKKLLAELNILEKKKSVIFRLNSFGMTQTKRQNVKWKSSESLTLKREQNVKFKGQNREYMKYQFSILPLSNI
jgi:hypothetical protein